MFECAAIAPAWFCRHSDVLLYLAPSLLLALVIRRLSACHPFFFLFTLAGTICHELAHFCVGMLTGARPAAFTVIPRRVGNGWQLGSVCLTRVRWYNAAPAALAPFLVAVLPLLVALWRTRPGWHFESIDLLLAFARHAGRVLFEKARAAPEDVRVSSYIERKHVSLSRGTIMQVVIDQDLV